VSAFVTLSLRSHADKRGRLTVLQDVLPFETRRTFWITGADGHVRGGHRHHNTRQALVALTGAVAIFMNDGEHRSEIVLDRPDRCLIVEPDDWHTMSFGPGSVLLVMASHPYDVADYIDERYPE
jgi:mannose-6-phosphate isomerase-like protein (cupin superfamily)